MHARGRTARAIRLLAPVAASERRVWIENHHPVGASVPFQQGDHLRLIGPGDGGVVIKIGNRGRHSAKFETGVVESQPTGDLAHVMDIDLMAFQFERHLRLAAGEGGAFELRFGRLLANEGQRRAQLLSRSGVTMGLRHVSPP